MMKCYPEGLVKLFTDGEALRAGLNPAYVQRLLEGQWPADRSDVAAWRAKFNTLLLCDNLRQTLHQAVK